MACERPPQRAPQTVARPWRSLRRYSGGKVAAWHRFTRARRIVGTTQRRQWTNSRSLNREHRRPHIRDCQGQRPKGPIKSNTFFGDGGGGGLRTPPQNQGFGPIVRAIIRHCLKKRILRGPYAKNPASREASRASLGGVGITRPASGRDVLTLKIIATTPYCCCMPWHARGYEREAVHGAACCFCDRAIAAPEKARGKIVACIYCGMDRGFIPAEEIEPL